MSLVRSPEVPLQKTKRPTAHPAGRFFVVSDNEDNQERTVPVCLELGVLKDFPVSVSTLPLFFANFATEQNSNGMEQLVEISRTQVIMAFVATCIEATARLLGSTYQDVYQRMKRVGMIEQYIIPHYDTLHTESRENIVNGMLECLNRWEDSK